MIEVNLTEENGAPLRSFLYRVVDVHGDVYAGYNNRDGTFRTLSQARMQIGREKAHVDRWNSHPNTIRSGNFKDMPILRIDRAEIVWERIEE